MSSEEEEKQFLRVETAGATQQQRDAGLMDISPGIYEKMDEFDIPDEIMNKHLGDSSFDSNIIQGALDGIVSFSRARQQLVGKVRDNAEVKAIAV